MHTPLSIEDPINVLLFGGIYSSLSTRIGILTTHTIHGRVRHPIFTARPILGRESVRTASRNLFLFSRHLFFPVSKDTRFCSICTPMPAPSNSFSPFPCPNSPLLIVMEKTFSFSLCLIDFPGLSSRIRALFVALPKGHISFSAQRRPLFLEISRSIPPCFPPPVFSPDGVVHLCDIPPPRRLNIADQLLVRYSFDGSTFQNLLL